MNTKKVIAVVLAAGIIACSSALYYKMNVNSSSSNGIDQNVVYAKSDSSENDGNSLLEDSLNDYKITGEDKDAYDAKTKEALKQYFDIFDNEFSDMTFRASRSNEQTLTQMQEQLKEHVQEAYDNNKISKEEYDTEMEYCNGGPKDSYAHAKATVEKLKHGMISAIWIDNDRVFQCIFNENTKELDEIMVNENHDSSETPLTLSEYELKTTAEVYIKKFNLGELKNPNCVGVKEVKSNPESSPVVQDIWHVYYKEADDDSKTVIIGIDAFTGKVMSFDVNGYANYMYDNIGKNNN